MPEDDEEDRSPRTRPTMLGGGYPAGERIRALEEGFRFHREQIHAANNRLQQLSNAIGSFEKSVDDLENKLERFERVQQSLASNIETLQSVNKSLTEKELERQRRRQDVKSVAGIVGFVVGTLTGVMALWNWLGPDAATGP